MDESRDKLVDIHQSYVLCYAQRPAEDEEFASAKLEFDDLVPSEAPPAI